jgi:hypothetical protein
MPQTTYTDAPVKAYLGGVSDEGVKDLITKSATASAIPFGRFVSLGSADSECKLPAASGDVGNKTWGVAVAHTAQEPNSDGGYARYANVTILNKGRVWMYAEQDCTLSDDVYVRYTANGAGKDVGQVRKDDDTSKAAALTRAKFVSTASAGELVLVELE